jgi:hypothetical protein
MTSCTGSNPSVAGERKGSCRDDSIAVDLLRLLTMAKRGNSPISPIQGQKEFPPDHEGKLLRNSELVSRIYFLPKMCIKFLEILLYNNIQFGML